MTTHRPMLPRPHGFEEMEIRVRRTGPLRSCPTTCCRWSLQFNDRASCVFVQVVPGRSHNSAIMFNVSVQDLRFKQCDRVLLGNLIFVSAVCLCVCLLCLNLSSGKPVDHFALDAL